MMLSACRLSTCTKLLIALAAPLLLTVFTTTEFRSVPPSKRLAKAVIDYPSLPKAYKQALALHNEHNARFGYGQHSLRVPMVRGGANLFYFLISIIADELVKPVESRAE